ncbi:MAG: DUF5020 family protein [Tannerellaceae bacterium]|jgi:hypothetical protein|nr:DUF5020 family protein [Tannerellaceae bacterium]
MKKLSVVFFFAVGAYAVQAQNIQLHYDLGSALHGDLKGRPSITSTVEHFIPDKWGSTFFFVDMDYANGGVSYAYWEIARELSFWQGPISAHVEYNGGMYIGNSYLAGATYTCNSPDFSKGFSLSALYKNIRKTEDNKYQHNFQLTGVWHMSLAQGLCDFAGFVDFWQEKNNHGNFIFLSEPQFWVNLNKIKGVDDKLNLSVGTEVEFSNNFGGRDGFFIIPTLAAKWKF